MKEVNMIQVVDGPKVTIGGKYLFGDEVVNLKDFILGSNQAVVDSYGTNEQYIVPFSDLKPFEDNADIGFRELQKQLHQDSFNKGWWHDDRGFDLRDHPFTFPTKAMLVVSEMSEAIEGDRKDIADTHLPQYPMRAVELADAQIRLMDLAEAYGIDLLEIIKAKRQYNRERKDHKPENRAKKHGKKY